MVESYGKADCREPCELGSVLVWNYMVERVMGFQRRRWAFDAAVRVSVWN